ncbi:MAG: helix-turn-helix transcriptional regulator [Myxococcota bacterium]
MHSHHHRRRSRHGRRHRSRRNLWGGLRGRFFGPGELRLALLALLGEGPRHGYELMKQLEARSGGLYRASAGSVYPTLQQLEDEGLARSESQDGKRVYRLTPEGERLVEEDADDVRRIWRRAEEWGDWGDASRPEVWEIVRPLKDLAKAALRTATRDDVDDETIDRLRDILSRARKDVDDLRRRDEDEPERRD